MGDDCCKWKFCTKSGLKQVKVECGDDLRRLKDLDQKYWTALAASNTGLRSQRRLSSCRQGRRSYADNDFRCPLQG